MQFTERDHVPDLLVEKLRNAELSDDDAAKVRQRLAQGPEGIDRVASLRASDAEILATYPTAEMASQIDARVAAATGLSSAATQRASATPAWTWGAPLAIAATAALFMLRVGDTTPATKRAETASATLQLSENRVKGLQPHLQVFRKQDERVERLKPGHTVMAGDVLQLRYVAGDAAHGVIVSIDGRGEVTLHFPTEPAEPTKLERGKAIALPHAYELDDAPDFERFVLITAAEAIEVESVQRAARALRASTSSGYHLPLDLPPEQQQFSFSVEKAAR